MKAAQLSVIIFLMSLCVFARAEAIAVYQIEQPAGDFIQVSLDHDIYRYSSKPDLSDLLVVDALGNTLPHRVTASPPKITTQSRELPLRFFPVVVGAAPETLLALSSASIRLDDNEISVSVEKKDKPQNQDTSVPIDFFLIDLSDSKDAVDALKVDWAVNERNQYIQVEVSGTNDLTNWNSLTKNTLVQLQKDGQSLLRTTIPLGLAPMQYAYLRLKFIGAGDHFTPITIASKNMGSADKTFVMDEWEVHGELAGEQTSLVSGASVLAKSPVAAWEFLREDISPLEQIRVQLGAFMYGDTLRIFSRPHKKEDWRLVHEGIWFNVQVGSTWQQSEPILVNGNSDSLWRIELNESVRAKVQPILRVSRQPELLQFIASTHPPFKISIETDSQKNIPANQQIFSQITAGKEIRWSHVDVTRLSPDIDQFVRHGIAVSWKSILFWSVLLLAVALLLFLALRLAKQVTNHSESSQGA